MASPPRLRASPRITRQARYWMAMLASTGCGAETGWRTGPGGKVYRVLDPVETVLALVLILALVHVVLGGRR